MKCSCNFITRLKNNDALKYIKILRMLKVDSNNYKKLYQCPLCNTYFEEVNASYGHATLSEILKVDAEYVIRNWDDI